jgi:hypothetical protein
VGWFRASRLANETDGYDVPVNAPNLPSGIPAEIAAWLEEWLLELSVGRPGEKTVTV